MRGSFRNSADFLQIKGAENDRCNGYAWVWFRGEASDRTRQPPARLDVSLFRNLQGIIDFNAKIANCAFDLRVSEQ
jgi:hypothetical protein